MGRRSLALSQAWKPGSSRRGPRGSPANRPALRGWQGRVEFWPAGGSCARGEEQVLVTRWHDTCFVIATLMWAVAAGQLSGRKGYDRLRTAASG
jgi:hypothetical protein